MYISKREYGGECLEMGVDEGTDLTDFGIGKQVQVTAVGTIKAVRAPYKAEDYMIDRPTKAPDNWKRPLKTFPGRVEIDLEGKPSMAASAKPSGIADLTAMMDSDEGDDY